MSECNWHYNFQFREFKFYCKACGKEENPDVLVRSRVHYFKEESK